MTFSNFEIFEKLGHGAFSIVYKVRRISDGQFYAMKSINLGNISVYERQKALNEVRLLASIEHPNIVQYKECFLEGDMLGIIMEKAESGDL